jgi:2'-5' RNA ligase
MVGCGFAPETHPYHPHITLARFHGTLRLSQIQRALPPSLPRSFIADTVNLYRSPLTPTGSQYEILARKQATRPNKSITHP